MIPETPRPQGSILRRLIWQAVSLTALTIVVLAGLSLLITLSLVTQSAVSESATLAAVGEESIERSLRYARERTVLLSAHADIRGMAADSFAADAQRAWFLALEGTDPSLPVTGLRLQNDRGEAILGVGYDIPPETPGQPGTVLVPSVTASGVTVYDVYSPVRADGETVGMLSLRYDASSVMEKLATLSLALGDTGEAMLAIPGETHPVVFRPSTDARAHSLLSLPRDADTPTLRALGGSEGVAEMRDDEGRDVFAAYRYLPDIGWGFVMTVRRSEVFAQVRSLTVLISLIGFFLLLLSGVVAVSLSRTITRPLRTLSRKVQSLRPGSWAVERTVHTGDEVELLDLVVVDMATRLRKVYESLEEVIRERTQELAKQYARDRAILENIGYAVIAVDARGFVTDANPAAVALLGTEASALYGKPVTDVVRLRAHRGDPIEAEHPVMHCLRSKTPVHPPASAHWSVQKTDQSLVPVSCSVSPLYEHGDVFGAILVLQDVSEERRLDYLKSEFITLASHQLRTPLSALRWYVELMGEESGGLSDDQKGYVKEMGVSLKRMSNLLDSLLRASQMEENGLGVSLQETDIKGLITETDEDFRSIAQEHGISFSASLPDEEVRAVTDPTLLRIVLQNLLSNATKYTAKDGHVSLVLDKKPSGFRVDVTDEGMGIPAAEQKRVFQKFFRAKNVRQMDTDGNGLGLYITKSIVERLGGAIAFKSEEGKGTTFSVEFPLQGKPDEPKKTA